MEKVISKDGLDFKKSNDFFSFLSEKTTFEKAEYDKKNHKLVCIYSRLRYSAKIPDSIPSDCSFELDKEKATCSTFTDFAGDCSLYCYKKPEKIKR